MGFISDRIKSPPKFDGLNFPIWKVKMALFLKSLRSKVAKAVTKGFKEPQGDEDTWSEIENKEFDAKSKAHYALMQALNDDHLSHVINCISAYEFWQFLITIHEGTS